MTTTMTTSKPTETMTRWDDDERNTKVVAPCGRPAEEFVDMRLVLKQILEEDRRCQSPWGMHDEEGECEWDDFDCPLYCDKEAQTQSGHSYNHEDRVVDEKECEGDGKPEPEPEVLAIDPV